MTECRLKNCITTWYLIKIDYNPGAAAGRHYSGVLGEATASKLVLFNATGVNRILDQNIFWAIGTRHSDRGAVEKGPNTTTPLNNGIVRGGPGRDYNP